MSEGKEVLVLERSSGKTERIATITIPEEYKDVPVQLRISGDCGKYSFVASFDGINWQNIAENVDATNLSTNVAGGFVGTLIGPYATSAANTRILKDIYSDYFSLGVAVSKNHLDGKEKALLLKHFSSLTAENAMKPESLIKKDGTYNWNFADKIMNFAKENKLLLRGHTLVWHNQTPSWFFMDDKGNFVDSTTMYKRMEKYMTEVMTHFKGSVYCWDVVNEAISDKKDEMWRTNSGWYETCGTG
jgi:GH35 family endo-1,4-beta-xylanase